jgi:hypothetical protein
LAKQLGINTDGLRNWVKLSPGGGMTLRDIVKLSDGGLGRGRGASPLVETAILDHHFDHH